MVRCDSGEMCIRDRFYAAVVLDRQKGRLVLMVSTEGGMDIEEVAAHQPGKIFKAVLDPIPVSYTHLDVYKRQPQ